MASSKTKLFAIIFLALAGMALCALTMSTYTQAKIIEDFLSCGATCAVDQYTNMTAYFGVLSVQLVWGFFALIAGLAIVLADFPRLARGKEQETWQAVQALAVGAVAFSGYAAYQALFVFKALEWQILGLLVLSVALLGLAIRKI